MISRAGVKTGWGGEKGGRGRRRKGDKEREHHMHNLKDETTLQD